jgi:hypothetical protein
MERWAEGLAPTTLLWFMAACAENVVGVPSVVEDAWGTVVVAAGAVVVVAAGAVVVAAEPLCTLTVAVTSPVKTTSAQPPLLTSARLFTDDRTSCYGSQSLDSDPAAIPTQTQQ